MSSSNREAFNNVAKSFLKVGFKTQSIMDKNSGLLNSCEARKNLNEKIMKKYKNSQFNQNNNKDLNSPKMLQNNNKANFIYDKFLNSTKIKKNNLMTEPYTNQNVININSKISKTSKKRDEDSTYNTNNNSANLSPGSKNKRSTSNHNIISSSTGERD